MTIGHASLFTSSPRQRCRGRRLAVDQYGPAAHIGARHLPTITGNTFVKILQGRIIILIRPCVFFVAAFTCERENGFSRLESP